MFGLTGTEQGSRIRNSCPSLDTRESSAARKRVGFMASVFKNEELDSYRQTLRVCDPGFAAT